MSIVYFGGGCFWCLEAFFSRIDGVNSVVSGYSGGNTPNPNYEQVCSGETGHAEVIQITFDTKKTNYEILLDWFWRCHDPTTLNRQGGDIGTQYRSVIFFHSENQKNLAINSKEELQKKRTFKDLIVTEIIQIKDWQQRNHISSYKIR